MRLFLPLLALTLSTSLTHAQTITESWLALAASACGAGISIEASAEIEGTLLRRLQAVDGSASGSYDATTLKQLLDQFEEEDRSAQAHAYRECLLNLVQTGIDTSGLPPKEVVLTSPVAVAPLDIVKRGQRFVVTPGEAKAIAGPELLFSIVKFGADHNGKFVHFSWSNSQTGKQVNNTYVYQTQIIDFGENCRVVPYLIDLENQRVSIISNC